MADAKDRADSKRSNPALALAALGVVFGDIGTSPLYAFRQCFATTPSATHTPETILGVLSLITWSLVVVVCIKYAGTVMRFDSNGHGGILALLELLRPASSNPIPPRSRTVTYLALLSVGMLVGDGMITPSISVMSAVEGVKVVATGTGHLVVPISLAILIGLFALQFWGTQRIGIFFGPLMCLWFGAIGFAGACAIVREPQVLRALDPVLGVRFLFGHGLPGLLIMGAVVLAVTGCEALYADMSHLGRRAIILAWYGVAFPALLLNYYGQGAQALRDPGSLGQPFFALVPHSLLVPMVVLATLATVIASQALISGVFTLAEQSMALSFLPRLRVINTSRTFAAQVFVPAVNAGLGILCVLIVVTFQSSARLAAAYGLAVTVTMTITTVFFWLVATRARKWPFVPTCLLAALLLAFDLSFLFGSLPKLLAGGWLPISASVVVFIVGSAWLYGRRRLKRSFVRDSMRISEFVKRLDERASAPKAGIAVFLTADTARVPFARSHDWVRAHAPFEDIVLLSIRWKSTPFVQAAHRANVSRVRPRLLRVTVDMGFMEQPTLRIVADACKKHQLDLSSQRITFFSIDPLIKAKSHKPLDVVLRAIFSTLLMIRYPLMRELQIPASRSARLGLEIPW